MNVSEMQPLPRDFADRLEAELVKVVTARAARAQRPGQRAARAMRRPALRAGVLAIGTAVAAAGFAVGGLSIGHRQAGSPQPGLSTGAAPVHIRTASFSVDTDSAGTVRVTWNKSQYIQDAKDVAVLQRALREAGFPVLIKEGVFCQGPHDNGDLGPSGVGPGVGRVMQGANGPDGSVVFTFAPAAMPAGEELFIGYLSPSQVAITHGQPGSVERLVPTGVPLACTTQAPLPQSTRSER